MGKVLVTVLDWGLGHASRSSRIIRELKNLGHDVILASSGSALEFLKIEFPQARIFSLPSYRIRYAKHQTLNLIWLFLRLPHFFRVIHREHLETEELLRLEKVDWIISDNRYGCYSGKVPSVFLGHQLTVPLTGWYAFFQPIINYLHVRQIKKFSVVWVPDDPTFSVAGKMGYVPGISPIHIGFLSRLSAPSRTTEHPFFITVIISGPEPAREKFSMQMERILLQFDEPCMLIRGVPSDPLPSVKKKNLTICHFLSTADLNEVILNSKYIISRSGYSSIMDFIATQSRVLFVPTPGQPEQEFLAKHLHDQFASVYLEQSDLSPSAIRSALTQVKPLGIKSTGNLLQEAFRSITFAAN